MDTTTLASAFYKDGYCVVKDIFPADSVEDIRENAIRNFINVKNIIEESRRDFGIGIKHGFKEIVQRHSNRFEMPYGMEDSIYDFVLANKNLREILTEILQCSDYIVANRSLVVSLPGAEEQAWHSDGPHMSMQEHLPCHCLNVFIPLIPVNSSNGPTEIRPGSHYYSRDLTKLYLLAFMRKQIQAPIAPDLDIGSILMFDYRVLHRGKSNLSEFMRPILVFTFSKPWYKDVLNFPSRSVHDKEDKDEDVRTER